MPTIITKESYQRLMDQDIARIDKEMERSPERDHIKAILLWSVDALYKQPTVGAIPPGGDFKFELGQIVTHVSNMGNQRRMVILARGFEETVAGVMEMYTVSCHEVGQVYRPRLGVMELRLVNPKDHEHYHQD